MLAAHRTTLLVAIGVAAALGGVSAQQNGHVETPREQWQRHPEILSELGATTGARIADVGAGAGWFTRRISKAVGDSGRVYAIDVNPISLRELREGLGTDHPNVEIVRGEENDPKLPPGMLNGVLIVNAYHEFAEYQKMLGKLHEALRPGGKLVLVEPIPRAGDRTRGAQTKRHSIGIDLAEGELKDAGFDIVKKDPGFVSRPEHRNDAATRAGENAATDWLLVAQKPS
jgi:predicted methyltransferase